MLSGKMRYIESTQGIKHVFSFAQLLQMAIDREEQGDFAEAEKCFDLAVAYTNDSSDSNDRHLAYGRLAAFLRRRKRDREAEAVQNLLSDHLKVHAARFDQQRLDLAKNTIQELVSSGAISDEQDAMDKLSNLTWLSDRGLVGELSTLLRGEFGRRACQMIFQQTSTLSAITDVPS